MDDCPVAASAPPVSSSEQSAEYAQHTARVDVLPAAASSAWVRVRAKVRVGARVGRG